MVGKSFFKKMNNLMNLSTISRDKFESRDWY